MATFKCTWFFQDPVYNYGWTENWWTNASNAAAAAVQVTNYGAKRSALMMDTAQWVQLRISNVDPPRDSAFYGPASPVNGSIAHATYPVAGVWDCLLCTRNIASNALLGHLFFHAVPAGIFVGRVYTPSGVPTAVWTTPLIAYGAEVTGGLYLIRQKVSGTIVYTPCTQFGEVRRTERRVGRPFDPLRGRRLTA